mmetsp:Transcript_35660/g.83449  ORF Transcript_35660/g.83449 Transcript_35660/m.83449 type:complete len:163 (-) Transcript_35660:101-589(-)
MVVAGTGWQAALCRILLLCALYCLPSAAVSSDPLGEVKGLIRNRLQHLHSQDIAEADPQAWCDGQQDQCEKKIQDANQELDRLKAQVQESGIDPERCLYGPRPAPTQCYDLSQASRSLQLHMDEKEALLRHCSGAHTSSYEDRQARRQDLIDRLSEAHGLLR